MQQTYTSAGTSQKQLPALHKYLDRFTFHTLLDYGCGKYDVFKRYVESLGKTYFGYDKYNQPEHVNDQALSCKPDLITCANVLNVIDNDDTLNEIIAHIASYGVPAIFSVYEGDRSGVGKVTKKDCYQRNQRASFYTTYLEKHFACVERKGNIFFTRCT